MKSRSSSQMMIEHGKLYGRGPRKRHKHRASKRSAEQPHYTLKQIKLPDGTIATVKLCPPGNAIKGKPDIDGRLKAQQRKLRRGERKKTDWKRIVA